MASNKNKKPRLYTRRHVPVKTLFAVALTLGAIIAGLLLLSYQPNNNRADIANDQVSISSRNKASLPDDSFQTFRAYPPVSGSKDKHTKGKEASILSPHNPSILKPEQPCIAIIMDDLGGSSSTAKQVAKLNIPVTMAIIPDLDYAEKTMHIAEQHGREVMVHLPMQPLNYPHHNPGKMALMLDMDEAEIKKRTAYYLHKLPLAKGCNNHMGSAFTQKPRQMGAALKQISARGLYFVDSLTSSNSVAAEQAHKLRVPSAKRDVFLDNERDVDKILQQLNKLFKIGQKNGTAIGICHPYPETISALDSCDDLANKYNVTIVPASKLVR